MFHHHARFSHKICDAIEATPARIVTPIRDPYDVFVSLYYWSQEKAATAAENNRDPKERPRDAVVSNSLDDPAVFAFLENAFGSHFEKATQWLHSGRAVPIRYEELHRDPVSELKRATDQIEPVSIERIQEAIAHCSADNMRQMNEKLARHVRAAKVGDSKERLSDTHLAIFRDRYADAIRALGYEVRGETVTTARPAPTRVAATPVRSVDDDRDVGRAREGSICASNDAPAERPRDMRIVITSPPKTGNKWLKCLLSSIYDLTTLRGSATPDTNPARFRAWVEAGNFTDGHIFHQHCRFSRRLADTIDAVPAHSVTIIRDPYDQFVSLYYWLQTRATFDEQVGKVRPRQRPRDRIVGLAIDDPLVIEYLRTDFQIYLDQANEWLHSGRSVVFRYEHLHQDPLAELRRGTTSLRTVGDEEIIAAMAACSVENMRQKSEKMASHIRSATVGDSKQRLSDIHFTIFRDQYGELIRSLGYDVR
jgi:hypothetical protein